MKLIFKSKSIQKVLFGKNKHVHRHEQYKIIHIKSVTRMKINMNKIMKSIVNSNIKIMYLLL